jgi:alcohol dehydrogenase-like protein
VFSAGDFRRHARAHLRRRRTNWARPGSTCGSLRPPCSARKAVAARAISQSKGSQMKAMVFHGPDKKSWEEVPDATIQKPSDVVVKVETTTICGTDLHILKGDVPAVQDGRVLGHEGVGTTPRSARRSAHCQSAIASSCPASAPAGIATCARNGCSRTASPTRAHRGSAGSRPPD